MVSDAFYGQILFVVGIVVPLVIVCCLRWICKTRHGRTPNSDTQAPARPSPTYQEVESLPRTLSYYDPPNGDPPPTYESIQRIPHTQTLTYIDEHGNSKEVKWDGGAAIPTHPIGHYNPAFLIGEEVVTEDSSVEEYSESPEGDPGDNENGGHDPPIQDTSETPQDMTGEANGDVQTANPPDHGTIQMSMTQESAHVDRNIGEIPPRTSSQGLNIRGNELAAVEQTPNVESAEIGVGSAFGRQESSVDTNQVT